MAASFYKNRDLELNYELFQIENPKYLSLPNKTGKMTNLIWILIFVILILVGIIMFLATQVITSGPQDTESINVGIQGCGGIINVDTTTQIKFRDIFVNSCTWIIKSDAKMLILQWSNTEFPQDDEILIGELSLAEEELYCRSIKVQGNWTTEIVFTPAILSFKSSAHPKSLDFEVKLDPITSRGTHKSQPQTYYVNKKPAGSLGHHIVRPEGLLGMVTVFENNYKRQLNCSDLKEATVQCCNFVHAYKMDSANGSTSCTKVPLSKLAMEMSSHRAVVVLAPTYGFCQFNWKEAEVNQWEFEMPQNVTQVWGTQVGYPASLNEL